MVCAGAAVGNGGRVWGLERGCFRHRPKDYGETSRSRSASRGGTFPTSVSEEGQSKQVSADYPVRFSKKVRISARSLDHTSLGVLRRGKYALRSTRSGRSRARAEKNKASYVWQAMYYVYLIRSKKNPNQTYIGQTDDLKERLLSHNSGANKYTSKYRP